MNLNWNQSPPECGSPSATEGLDELKAQNTVLSSCNAVLMTQVSSVQE